MQSNVSGPLLLSIIYIYIYIYIHTYRHTYILTLEHFLQANQISYLQQQLELMTQTRAHESTYAGQQIQQLARQVEDLQASQARRRETEH